MTIHEYVACFHFTGIFFNPNADYCLRELRQPRSMTTNVQVEIGSFHWVTYITVYVIVRTIN